MRNGILAGCTLSLIAAMPARAAEPYIEIHGGTLDNATDQSLTGGGGAGIDFDLAKNVFAGIEGTFDLSSYDDPASGKTGFTVYSGTARVGGKLGDRVKLYVLGGVIGSSGLFNGSSLAFGGGGQVRIAHKFFGRIEYRRSTETFTFPGTGDRSKLGLLTAGVGLAF